MAEQETLHNSDPAWRPEDHGTWKRFQDGDDGYWLNGAAINRARAGLEVVGSCRDCGGDLLVARNVNHEGSTVDTWVDLSCAQCGKEVAAPGGRRLARSSRHMKMPPAWLARRFAALKAAATSLGRP